MRCLCRRAGRIQCIIAADCGKKKERLKSNVIKYFQNTLRNPPKIRISIASWVFLSNSNFSKFNPANITVLAHQISRSYHSFLQAYQPKQAVVITKEFVGIERIDGVDVHFIPLECLDMLFALLV